MIMKFLALGFLVALIATQGSSTPIDRSDDIDNQSGSNLPDKNNQGKIQYILDEAKLIEEQAKKRLDDITSSDFANGVTNFFNKAIDQAKEVGNNAEEAGKEVIDEVKNVGKRAEEEAKIIEEEAKKRFEKIPSGDFADGVANFVNKAVNQAGEAGKIIIDQVKKATGSEDQGALLCMAVDPCVFPFKDGGITYDSCTATDLSKEEQDQGVTWCSKEVNSEGEHKWGRWGKCSKECQEKANGCLTEDPCVFPFEYNGKTYDKCTSDDLSEEEKNRGETWCSIESGKSGRWGKCQCTKIGYGVLDTDAIYKQGKEYLQNIMDEAKVIEEEAKTKLDDFANSDFVNSVTTSVKKAVEKAKVAGKKAADEAKLIENEAKQRLDDIASSDFAICVTNFVTKVVDQAKAASIKAIDQVLPENNSNY